MMKLPYGYLACENNKIKIDAAKADIVKMIFERYMAGDSLGKIAATLSDKQIVSPSGKSVWSGAAIDRLLSNKKYIPHIVSMEQFFEAQFEKTRRSSIDADTGKRICKSSPTVTDNEVKDFICETLGIPAFEDSKVKQSINEITVTNSGTFSAEFKDEHVCEMALQL